MWRESDTQAYLRIGNAELKRGNYDAALEAYESARTEAPLKGIDEKIRNVNKLKEEQAKRAYVNPEEVRVGERFHRRD